MRNNNTSLFAIIALLLLGNALPCLAADGAPEEKGGEAKNTPLVLTRPIDNSAIHIKTVLPIFKIRDTDRNKIAVARHMQMDPRVQQFILEMSRHVQTVPRARERLARTASLARRQIREKHPGADKTRVLRLAFAEMMDMLYRERALTSRDRHYTGALLGQDGSTSAAQPEEQALAANPRNAQINPESLKQAEEWCSDFDIPVALAILGYPGEVSPGFRTTFEDTTARLILSQIGYLQKNHLADFHARDVIYSLEQKRVCYDMRAVSEPKTFKIGGKTFLSQEGLFTHHQLDPRDLVKAVFELVQTRLKEKSLSQKKIAAESVPQDLAQDLHLTELGREILGTMHYILTNLEADSLVPAALAPSVRDFFDSGDLKIKTIYHSLLSNRLELYPGDETEVAYPDLALTIEGHNSLRNWLLGLRPSKEYLSTVKILRAALRQRTQEGATALVTVTHLEEEEEEEEAVERGTNTLALEDQESPPTRVTYFNPEAVAAETATRLAQQAQSPSRRRHYPEYTLDAAVPPVQHNAPNATIEPSSWKSAVRQGARYYFDTVAGATQAAYDRLKQAYYSWRPSKEMIESFDLASGGPDTITDMHIKVAEARLNREEALPLLDLPENTDQTPSERAYLPQALELAGIEPAENIITLIGKDRSAARILKLVGYLHFHGGKNFSPQAIALSLQQRHVIQQPPAAALNVPIDFVANHTIFRLQNGEITMIGDDIHCLSLLGIKALNAELSPEERFAIFNAATTKQRVMYQKIGALVMEENVGEIDRLLSTPEYEGLITSAQSFDRKALHEPAAGLSTLTLGESLYQDITQDMPVAARGLATAGALTNSASSAVTQLTGSASSKAREKYLLLKELATTQIVPQLATERPRAPALQNTGSNLLPSGPIPLQLTSTRTPAFASPPSPPQSPQKASRSKINGLVIGGCSLTLGGALLLLSQLRQSMPFAGKILDQLRMSATEEELSSPVQKTIYRAYGPKRAPIIVAFLGMSVGAAMIAYGVRN